MNRNEKFVITVNRELGSGGRTVGRLLAERLEVPFYDKVLIRALQEKYNLSVAEIERLKAQSNSWWANFKRVVGIGQAINPNLFLNQEDDEPETLTTEMIFQTEKEILLGMAQDESCIIAGRSAFFVLKSHPNHISILIQAPIECRIKRVMEHQKLSEEEAKKTINRVDKMREEYVKNFAKTSRYDTRNYDLVINMEGKSEEEAVDLILKYIG
ncbi:AAA family ATPase [Xylanibacter ruminicola]|uniref:Cytidylate kinase n=1 Tax=Xylanibacter ruminicola TaxID=839 RepID=A0A1M6XNE3_XYLRU|nr:cytidylate kinase-like family protein [Xylanibacter ruminicola]SHL07315.1 Cytidylate kinase [Xylanibacter ruminicola]